MLSDKSSRRIVDASLLRAIVDQFVSRPSHPVADIRQFEQLALGLIDIVDTESVARVARPLCFHPETPLSILQRLQEKGGACAELAFAFTPAPSRSDLLETASSGPAALACAIAQRADLDRMIVDALSHRSEHEVLRKLACNRMAHLDAAARRVLTQAARDDVTLARILLDRDDLEIDPEPLFLAATRLERTGIILNACRKIMMAGMTESHRAEPTFAARFEGAAWRRDRDGMAALLAEAFDCRKDRARALLSDPAGEAQALALAALGLEEEAATRVLLCADPAISHDVDRVRALIALVRSTPQRAASRIVAAMTGAMRAERDSPRRAGGREDALELPGWRRSAPRIEAAPARRLDKSG